jgi:hypothetical protein
MFSTPWRVRFSRALPRAYLVAAKGASVENKV